MAELNRMYVEELVRARGLVAHKTFIKWNRDILFDGERDASPLAATMIAFMRCAADYPDCVCHGNLYSALIDVHKYFTVEHTYPDVKHAEEIVVLLARRMIIMPQLTDTNVVEKDLEEQRLLPCSEYLLEEFAKFVNNVKWEVARAFDEVEQPIMDQNHPYFLAQEALGHTYFFEQKEKFKHGMRAAVLIRDRAFSIIRYACLRTIAHEIINTQDGMPQDYLHQCLGEQFGLAKKDKAKTSDVFFIQNYVSKMAVEEFTDSFSKLWASLPQYQKAAKRSRVFDYN